MKSKDKIIVALDVESGREAKSIINELDGHVGAFKVGLQLFTAEGAPFVRDTVERGVKLFLDLKFHDIPNTVASASIEVARLGVWMFNLHSLGGGEMMRRAAGEVANFCDRRQLRRPLMIAVTVLTSSSQTTLSEIGIDRDLAFEVASLSRLTAECGLDGVVASPHEAGIVKKEIGPEFMVVTPGIRPDQARTEAEKGTFDDQKRVTTPASATRAGSDFLVIGRPILTAPDRLEAVHQIVNEIDKANENFEKTV